MGTGPAICAAVAERLAAQVGYLGGFSVDGVLTDVLVAGGAPVEYGQPLFVLEPR